MYKNQYNNIIKNSVSYRLNKTYSFDTKRTKENEQSEKKTGKITTFKHWKYKTKAKIIKHSFETKQNRQSRQTQCYNGKMRTFKQWKYRTKANMCYKTYNFETKVCGRGVQCA